MELIIKMLFIMGLFMCNVAILKSLIGRKDEVERRTGFMLLCGMNVIVTTAILVVLHPYMLESTGLLVFSGFMGGAIILLLSTIPFIDKKK